MAEDRLGALTELAGGRPRVVAVQGVDLGEQAHILGRVAPRKELGREPIPSRRGVYTYYLVGYDAGTEANDEVIAEGGTPDVPGIPADPGGDAGIGGIGVAGPDDNTTVHIHRSIVGDLDLTGGPSDHDAGVHHRLNPAAKLTVTVGGSGRR